MFFNLGRKAIDYYYLKCRKTEVLCWNCKFWRKKEALLPMLIHNFVHV